LNGVKLADVIVKRDKEAEFDHWSDEGIKFPKVNVGDDLVIKYKNTAVIKGIFAVD